MLKKMNKTTKNNLITYAMVILAFVIMQTLISAGSISSLLQGLMVPLCTYIILAVSLNLVVGILGELSLGHAGFMCVGAFTSAFFSKCTRDVIASDGLRFFLALLIGIVTAAIFGMLIGIPVLRLKGDYLAIVTLAFCEIVHTLFKNSSRESFGGAFGLETPRYDRKYLYVIAFLFVMLTFAVLQNIIRSKHGRAVTAIRDNEIAARATGINVTKYKLMVFAVSAFFAGVAGVFFSFSNYTVVDTTFTYNYSIEILVMVVLGGMGNMVGSAISAVLITFLNDQLTNVLTGNLAVLQKLFYAVILVALVIYRNAPGLQGFRDKYNFRALSQRLKRKKDDPSKVKEDAGYWDRVPTKIEMDEILSTDVKVESNSSVRKDGDR